MILAMVDSTPAQAKARVEYARLVRACEWKDAARVAGGNLPSAVEMKRARAAVVLLCGAETADYIQSINADGVAAGYPWAKDFGGREDGLVAAEQCPELDE